MTNYFAPGATVVFRAYAVDSKTHKVLAAKDVKYFYVKIPNQPNVKLKYDPKAPGATPRLPWIGNVDGPGDLSARASSTSSPRRSRSKRSAAASSSSCRSRRRS